MKRLRIAHIIIQPVVAWDDGEELQPGPGIDAVTLSPSAAAEFIANLPSQVAELGFDLLRQEMEQLADARASDAEVADLDPEVRIA